MTAPTHEYQIDHRSAGNDYSPDSIGRYEDLDPAVADVLAAARDDEPRSGTRLDELPDGLRRALDRYEVFLGADEIRTVDPIDQYTLHELDPDAPPALDVVVTLQDDVATPGDPGVIEYSLTNTTDDHRVIHGGTAYRIDVPLADVTDGDRSIALWDEWLEEHSNENGIWDQPKETFVDIGAGETITKPFELQAATDHESPGDGLAPGTYVLEDSVRSSRSEDSDYPTEQFEVRLELSIEAR